MHQTHLVHWSMHVANSKSFGQRHLDGHSFTRGTLRGGGNLLGGLVNCSMSKGLREQQLASGSKLISTTHEVATTKTQQQGIGR